MVDEKVEACLENAIFGEKKAAQKKLEQGSTTRERAHWKGNCSLECGEPPRNRSHKGI